MSRLHSTITDPLFTLGQESTKRVAQEGDPGWDCAWLGGEGREVCAGSGMHQEPRATMTAALTSSVNL